LDDVDGTGDKARTMKERAADCQVSRSILWGRPKAVAEMTMTIEAYASRVRQLRSRAPPAERGIVIDLIQGEARADIGDAGRSLGEAANDEILQAEDIGHDDPQEIVPNSPVIRYIIHYGKAGRATFEDLRSVRSDSPGDMDERPLTLAPSLTGRARRPSQDDAASSSAGGPRAGHGRGDSRHVGEFGIGQAASRGVRRGCAG